MTKEPSEKKSRLEFTVKFIEAVKATDKEQRFTDAKTPGLTLAVKPISERKTDGSKLWRFRYLHNGTPKMISLGEYPVISLKEARGRVHEIRKSLDNGVDPSQERKIEKQTAAFKTFKAIAEAWLADRTENKWEATHAKRNKERFVNNIFPVFGMKNINDLTLSDFDKAFLPLKRRGALETAQRICAMCIEILSYAGRFRYLEDTNIIFDLQQYKKEDLPRPVKGKLATITEPDGIGELLHKIKEAEGRQTYPVALALQIAPYVMLRPGELVGGMWEEINLEKAEWYIKAERMKPGFDHVVPLPRQVMELIKQLHYFSGNGKYMFPSSSRGRSEHITTATLVMALRRMKYQSGDFTTHGFRAMASTILNGNKTHEIKGFDLPSYDPDLIEIQLSHAEDNKIRKAYNRRDPYARIKERREMLQTYADLLNFLRAAYVPSH
jgi:integrase